MSSMDLETKDLELTLLRHWNANNIKEIYKYKNSIKAFRSPLVNFELFKDLSSGSVFTDIKDITSHKFGEPEEYKVSVEELILKRTTL